MAGKAPALKRNVIAKAVHLMQLHEYGGRGTRTPKRLPAAVFKFGLLPLQIIVGLRIPEVKSLECKASALKRWHFIAKRWTQIYPRVYPRDVPRKNRED
jgi:hypothetical protein